MQLLARPASTRMAMFGPQPGGQSLLSIEDSLVSIVADWALWGQESQDWQMDEHCIQVCMQQWRKGEGVYLNTRISEKTNGSQGLLMFFAQGSHLARLRKIIWVPGSEEPYGVLGS